ncbi:MAG TPA: hypothetical protein VF909_09580 [Roseiflexaceae bacterium]
MPELTLLQLLFAALRARLAPAQPRDAGALTLELVAITLTLELVAITLILVAIAGVVFTILRAKAQQGATRISLP